jgi:alpha-tubulin suppressor-like RCC1 family protein
MPVFSHKLTALAACMALIACGSDVTTPPTPKSLAFATHAASIVADDELSLAATVTMSNGSVGPQSLIAYSSSAPAVATVDNKGVVKALAAGTATISAQVGSLVDQLSVTVSWAPITTISFGRDTATLLLDDSLSTAVIVRNSHDKPASNAVVTYSSSSPGVATVDANGRIRTFATGTATITATEESLHSDIRIAVVPQFTQIATGSQLTCGIAGTQRLYCWGSDIDGDLGDGMSSSDCTAQIGGHCSVMPIPVTGAERFVSVTAGEFHACALTSDGAAYCWGGNYYGQVGNGTVGGRVTVPTAVTGGHTFVAITAGRMGTCAIDMANDAWCWGWDSHGQLGSGGTGADRCHFFGTDEPCSGTPLKVAGNFQFVQLSAAEKITCGRVPSGAVYCWGGEVGGTDATDCQAGQRTDCARTPVLQVGGATFLRIGIGGVFRCGQKQDATVWCWGYDYDGAFGNGIAYTNSADTLSRVASGRPFPQITIGGRHMCGRTAGVVECWGYNVDGEAGGTPGTDRFTPGSLSGGIDFASVTSGPNSFTTCGISTAGRAYCWGFGQLGNLGNGTIATSSADPVLVKLVR